MAARSEAWVCGRLLIGIVGSSPARGMDLIFVFLTIIQFLAYGIYCG